MNFHWFGPSTPAWDASSEQAWAWTRAVVGALAEVHSVTLWMQELPSAPAVDGVEICCYPMEGQWRRLNDGGLAVYELSDDSRLHLGAWGTQRVHRGALVLRSQNLHRLLFEEYRLTNRLEDYVSAMSQWHGRIGRFAARRAVLCPDDRSWVAARFPLLDLAVARALGVAVEDPVLFEAGRDRWKCPLARFDGSEKSGIDSASIAGAHRAGWLERFEIFSQEVQRRRLATSLAVELAPRIGATWPAGAELTQDVESTLMALGRRADALP